MGTTKENLMQESANLIPVTEIMSLENGTLIGFAARNNGIITAAYAVWEKKPNNREIKFILNSNPEDERPIVDNTFTREEQNEFTAWVNNPPIVVKTNRNNAKTFQDTILTLFGG